MSDCDRYGKTAKFTLRQAEPWRKGKFRETGKSARIDVENVIWLNTLS